MAEKLKVLILNGSPRTEGNTTIAIHEMEHVFEENGVEYETIQVGKMDIRGCAACGTCYKNGKCMFDDIVNELAPKFEAADGMVIASPVFYASANATLIACLDRLFYSTKFDKTMKVGATDKNEVKKWEEVKKIQEDWINRLVDQNSLDYQMIRSAVVIAGTCVGFLSNEVIKDMSFDYVIIDEAAKATTPELLVSIIKAKKIILVGDQNQLPAYADAEVSPTLAKLTKNPDYRLFDILYNSLPDTHKQILTTQYRMIENIGNLISKVFYRGIIDTGCNDDEKRHGLSRYVGKSIVWFDTSANKKKSQKRTKGGSYINEEEKRIILEILDDLKSTGELKGLDIGIITGYSGQKELLRKSIKATGLDKIASKIDINTLDAFQGRENDIIIYSTVRTRDSIGFQKEKERVNVAFSRAKKLLIVCGDKNFFYNFDDQDNKFVEIIDYISEEEECEIIQCDGGKLFERESNS